MMSGDAAPSSWRDVYTLVRDTRDDVLAAVATVDGKVMALDSRVDRIESDRLTTVSAAKAEKRILANARGMVRESIAITISVVTAAIVVMNFLTGPR